MGLTKTTEISSGQFFFPGGHDKISFIGMFMFCVVKLGIGLADIAKGKGWWWMQDGTPVLVTTLHYFPGS